VDLPVLGFVCRRGRKYAAAGPEFVIHLAAPVRGEFNPLFSELHPKTIFSDIGLPSQGGKLL